MGSELASRGSSPTTWRKIVFRIQVFRPAYQTGVRREAPLVPREAAAGCVEERVLSVLLGP